MDYKNIKKGRIIMSLVYIASPYTHANNGVMANRRERVTAFAAKLINRGINAFSPIAYTGGMIEHFSEKHEWNHWLDFDLDFLMACDKMIVLTLPGWSESVGVAAEIEFAVRLGMEIEYMNFEDV